jgi:hypothetical protein
MSRLAAAAALAAALLACSRPQPSPEYEQARARWTALVQARGDDAAEDPGAEEVLALLGRVPPSSADAADAAALRTRIEGDRRARAEERARREKLDAAAGAPQAMPSAATEGAKAPGGAAERAEAAALPAGMKEQEFRDAYGDCFAPQGGIDVAGADGGAAQRGEMWTLKPDPSCREKHPSLDGKVVVFSGGALAGVAPAAAVRKVERREQVKVGALPDGGVGILVDGGVAPVPAGATLSVDAPDGGRAR